METNTSNGVIEQTRSGPRPSNREAMPQPPYQLWMYYCLLVLEIT